MKKILFIALIGSHTLCAQILFNPYVDYNVSGQPRFIATNDLNNDNKLDIVTSNGDNKIDVLIGNGNGTFTNYTSIIAGNFLGYVTIADLNNDNNKDIIVANENSETISILLGNGNGTFASPLIDTVQSYPSSIIATDFNNDGNLDLAVTNHDANSISILLGLGNGTFSNANNLFVGNNYNTSSITATDFNLDGKNDIAISNRQNGSISVLLGNGNGTFSTQIDYSADFSPECINFGDFNNDGKIDLVTTNRNNISVFSGSGTGTFNKIQTIQGTIFNLNTIADFDGDSILDLATSNYGSNSDMYIYKGLGTGLFPSFNPNVYSTGCTESFSITNGDFNNDGRQDISIVSRFEHRIVVFLNKTIPLKNEALYLNNNIKFTPEIINNTIKIESIIKCKNVKILNSVGQIVFNLTPNSKLIEIDVSQYSNGLYYIYINDESNSFITKLIKR
jgi:FG-GAP-like repeat/Secretion system C-terminal sorting domain